MSQVKVYAGDADHPAAHAHYKNLIWETISGRACLTFAFYFSLCSKIQGILIPAFICTALIWKRNCMDMLGRKRRRMSEAGKRAVGYVARGLAAGTGPGTTLDNITRPTPASPWPTSPARAATTTRSRGLKVAFNGIFDNQHSVSSALVEDIQWKLECVVLQGLWSHNQITNLKL